MDCGGRWEHVPAAKSSTPSFKLQPNSASISNPFDPQKTTQSASMKTIPLLILVLLGAFAAGCSEQGPRTVTAGVDPQAIRDYEAELGKVTKQDTDSNMGAKENMAEK